MKRHPWLVPFAILVPLAGAVIAQDKPGTPVPSRTEQRAQDMRDQIDTGKQVQSHVRVLVRLKNGNKLTGVVKDGRFVERVDGLRFVEAQAMEAGAGIRLWYSGGTRSYIFLPFAQFAEYEVLQRLSTKELGEIERQMQMEEKRAAERAAAAAEKAKGEAAAPPAAEAPSAGEGDGKPAPAGESQGGKAAPGKTPAVVDAEAAAKAKAQEQEKLWFRLVTEYPPSAGWGKAKCDEIKRRVVVVGAKPSPSEQFFADNYAEWEKACAHFAVTGEAGGEAEPPAGGKGKKGRKSQ